MSQCEVNISRIDLYLDDELAGNDLELFNQHIRECPSCREELSERRRFLERIRAARPLYPVSPNLRREVEAILGEAAGVRTLPAQGRPGRRASGKSRAWLGWLSTRPIPALAASLLAIAGLTILWRLSSTEARANDFVDLAAQTHRQRLADQLPLEIRTNSPSELCAWFTDKVPFRFRLPTYQETSGQGQQYELTGGRLVDFRGARAAYISYRMHGQIISLLLTAASSSVAAGGETTVSKAITFHAHRRDELQVVTWSVHDLTYALVSSVNLPLRQSCTVCHASAKDKNLIQNLKSRNKAKTNRNVLMFPSHRDTLSSRIPTIFDLETHRGLKEPPVSARPQRHDSTALNIPSTEM